MARQQQHGKLPPGITVFTCSLSDFFIADADPWRDEAWDIIRTTPTLTYQILTKRPVLIPRRLPPDWGDGWPNCWLGVTVESRAYLGRLDMLRRIPAAVRFVSLEPLLEDLGELDLRGFHWAIIGGESGPKRRRTCEVEWIRNAVRQCEAQGVAIFVKQDSASLRGRQGRLPDRLPERGRLRGAECLQRARKVRRAARRREQRRWE